MRATSLDAGADRGAVSRWVPTPNGELLRKQVASGLVRLEFWRDGFAPLARIVVERRRPGGNFVIRKLKQDLPLLRKSEAAAGCCLVGPLSGRPLAGYPG